MKNSKIKGFILIVALFMTNNFAYGQVGNCEVTTYFREIESGNTSDTSIVGKFLLEQDKDKYSTDETSKSFRHEESGIEVSVLVEVSGIVPKRIGLIRSQLHLAGISKETSGRYEYSLAETVYDKNWKYLSVSNEIRIGNRDYTFILSCAKNNKIRGR